MKKMKRIMGILLAMVLALSMSTVAFAQTADSGKGGSASITISNAANGETYKVFKLFNASVTGNEGGSIVYTGTIPDSLTDYFQADTSTGAITLKSGITMDDTMIAALKAWAGTATEEASAVSDGTALTFTGLQYGYYVVTSTQDSGSAITVTSTNPTATVMDKNTTEPSITKTVDDDNVYIGQTVTYTATATTANYLGEGTSQKKVVRYVIDDTLPSFLSDVTVTSITVGGTAITTQQFNSSKQIVIPWVDDSGNHLYNNGAQIVVTYTAKVTDSATVDGDGNTNTVTLRPYVEPDTPGDDPEPWDETWNDQETIKTYAAALKKVDENNNALAGATFSVKGLTVTGSNGEYTVTAFDNSATAADGTTMSTDERGYLIVKGLPSDVTLVLKEVAAPAGYNLLTGTRNWTPVIINETVTTSQGRIYYDADGNVTETETNTYITVVNYNSKIEPLALTIVNNKGNELPGTGGIGTTVFYVIGGMLVLCAAVVLVTRRRVNAK